MRGGFEMIEFYYEQAMATVQVKSYTADGIDFEDLEFEGETEYEGVAYNVYYCEENNTYYGSAA
jgi:hypothetical protein